jgi:transcriptional regulator with XRE-family HTH domain
MRIPNGQRYAPHMTTELSDFAVWLRDVAARAGYDPEKHGSTAKLARASGIDVGQISRFLNGKGVPSSPNLAALADALKVEVDEMARRIAGMEIRSSDVRVTDATNLSPEQMIAALGVTQPKDQELVLAMIERFRELEAQPKRDHRQRGVGGHPRPQSLNQGDQSEE